MGRWLSDIMVAIPPALAYLVVAVLATAESLFIGLVLPGELVLGRLTTAMQGATTLGSGRVTVPLLVLAGLLLARRGHRWSTAVLLVQVAAGTSLLVTAIKLLTTRISGYADVFTVGPRHRWCVRPGR